MEPNDQLSVRKYVLGFRWNDRNMYCAWGVDFNDDNEDKFLLNQENFILSFSGVHSIFEHLQNAHSYISFEETNFRLWGSILKDDYEVDFFDADELMIYLDKFNYDDPDLMKHNLYLLVDIINLINDYYYQVGDESQLEFVCSSNLGYLKELIQDRYLWDTDGKDELILSISKLVSDPITISHIRSILHSFFEKMERV